MEKIYVYVLTYDGALFSRYTYIGPFDNETHLQSWIENNNVRKELVFKIRVCNPSDVVCLRFF